MSTLRCPICYGAKTLTYFTVNPDSDKVGFLSGEDMIPTTIPCAVCNGTGEVDEAVRTEIENLRQAGKTDLRKLITDDPD